MSGRESLDLHVANPTAIAQERGMEGNARETYKQAVSGIIAPPIGDGRYPYMAARSSETTTHGCCDGCETAFLAGYRVRKFAGQELRTPSDLVVDDRTASIIAHVSGFAMVVFFSANSSVNSKLITGSDDLFNLEIQSKRVHFGTISTQKLIIVQGSFNRSLFGSTWVLKGLAHFLSHSN